MVDTVRDARRHAGFNIAIAEQHPGSRQAVRLGIPRRTPEITVIVDGAEVVAPAVAVVQQAVAVRHADPGGKILRIMAIRKIAAAPAADKPLIRQTQQVIAIQRAIELPGPGALLPAVIETHCSAEREFWRSRQINDRVALPVAGQYFYFYRRLAHAIELFHTLFDIAQVENFSFEPGEGHLQCPRRDAFKAYLLELTFQNGKLEDTTGEILFGQKCTAGDIAPADVPVRHGVSQGI